MRNDVCRFHIVLLKIVLAFVAGICVADADEPASDAPPSPTPSDGYHASIDYLYFIRDSSPRPARGIIPPLPSIESENKLLRVIREAFRSPYLDITIFLPQYIQKTYCLWTTF